MAFLIPTSIFASVLLSSQLISLVCGAPLPLEDGRWVNPCGGSSPAGGTSIIPLPTPPPQPVKTQLLTLKLTTKTAVSLSEEISNYIGMQYGSSFTDAIDKLPGSMTGIPDTAVTYTKGMKIEEFMTKEIERVSRIGVFLEEARMDNGDYVDTIKQLEDKYVQMLCQMHQMLKGQAPEAVSRSVMSEEYRNLKQTVQRDQRNYWLIRDAEKVYVSVMEGVDAYIQENKL